MFSRIAAEVNFEQFCFDFYHICDPFCFAFVIPHLIWSFRLTYQTWKYRLRLQGDWISEELRKKNADDSNLFWWPVASENSFECYQNIFKTKIQSWKYNSWEIIPVLGFAQLHFVSVSLIFITLFMRNGARTNLQSISENKSKISPRSVSFEFRWS